MGIWLNTSHNDSGDADLLDKTINKRKVEASHMKPIIESRLVRLNRSVLSGEPALPTAYFAVSWRILPAKNERRRQCGKWFEISSGEGTIFRVLQYSSALKYGENADPEILLDYSGWMELNGNSSDLGVPVKLTARRARWYQYPRLAVAHPDPSYRLASWVAMLSLVLGALALGLAVWTMFR